MYKCILRIQFFSMHEMFIEFIIFIFNFVTICNPRFILSVHRQYLYQLTSPKFRIILKFIFNNIVGLNVLKNLTKTIIAGYKFQHL